MTALPRAIRLFLVFILAQLAAAAGTEPRPTWREYDVLKAFPPGRLAALHANDMPDTNGFSGGNRTLGRWLEAGPQRGSCRAVIAAVVADDLAAADRAWRGIEVAFEHQREDGGFSATERPNGSSAATGGAAVETAYFFLQELGRAILVIRESPHEAHFRARIAALEPRLRKACDFLAAGEDTILPKSRKAVNRVLIAAKAFGTCGKVLGDERLVRTARTLVTEALRQRDSDGVFIEHGGRDSSYNAVSLLFGQSLALHVPLPELDVAFPAAARWQASRVLVSGEIDNRGNTRTGVGKEPGFNGQPKSINYNEVILALTYHGIVHRNPEVLGAADRIFAWTRRATERTAWKPGLNEITLDGRPRTVWLELPPNTASNAPLVLAFHGFTSNPDDLRRSSGLSAAAARRGWVVAYPAGSRDAKGRAFFQVGYDFHREEKVDDLRALRELAGQLVRDLDLEPRTVFATGFSNGGDFAHLLATREDAFVRAVAPVAGTLMSVNARPNARTPRIPILAVNLRDDPTTRWAGDPDNKDGWGAYLAAPAVLDWWAAAQSLPVRDVRELPGGFRILRARAAEGPGEVRLHELPAGGHEWPARIDDSNTPTAEAILAFFAQHLEPR